MFSKSSEEEKGLMAVLGKVGQSVMCVGSDNADNFAKFCQAQKLQFTIIYGLE